MRILLTHADNVALYLAPEVDIAVFGATDHVVLVPGEGGAEVELLVLVSLYFHYASSCHYVDEAHPAVICCDHGNVLVEEVNSGDLATS